LAYLHEIDTPVPARNLLKYLINIEGIDAICHDSSLNRRRMEQN